MWSTYDLRSKFDGTEEVLIPKIGWSLQRFFEATISLCSSLLPKVYIFWDTLEPTLTWRTRHCHGEFCHIFLGARKLTSFHQAHFLSNRIFVGIPGVSPKNKKHWRTTRELRNHFHLLHKHNIFLSQYERIRIFGKGNWKKSLKKTQNQVNLCVI